MSVETLGIRNNNPGNIRFTGIDWTGMIGKQGGFCVFDKMVNGTRAIAVIWRVYLTVDRVKTIREGIARWAPPTENDTSAYVAAVCRETGLNADDPISPTLETVRNIIAAIIQHENGQTMWSFFCSNRGGYNTIDEAITLGGWRFEETNNGQS